MKPDGALIRRRRIEGGHGLAELAREVGIDKSQLSKVERGIEGMSPRNLKKLSDKLNVPMHELAPELAEIRDPA